MVLTVAKTLLAKKLLNSLTPRTFLFGDLCFSFCFLLPFVPWAEVFSVSSDYLLVAAGIAIPGVVALVFLSKATKEGEISEVAPLMCLIPALTALTAPIVTGESVSAIGWLGIIVVLVGGYLLKLDDHRQPWKPFQALGREKAVRYLGVTISIAVLTVNFQKLLVLESSPKSYLFFHLLFLTALSLPLALSQGKIKGANLFRQLEAHFGWFVILGLVSLGSSLSLMTAFAMGAPVAYVLSIKRISIVFIAIIGVISLRESFRKPKMFGVVFMVAGGMILYLG